MASKCEGLPDRPCPQRRIDKSVKLCQGDLMLCKSCEKARFHTDQNDICNGNKQTSEKGETSSIPKGQCNNGLAKGSYETYPIIQPLLAYIAFSMNSGTMDAIKRAVLSHFSASQISEAKDVLWSKNIGCNDLLGTRTKRKGSSVRSETEANVQDILDALKVLDRHEKMPMFVIDFLSLSVIPRSHPEELNDISLCDRLNRTESVQFSRCTRSNSSREHWDEGSACSD